MKHPEVIRRRARFARNDPWANIPFTPTPPSISERVLEAIAWICAAWIIGYSVGSLVT